MGLLIPAQTITYSYGVYLNLGGPKVEKRSLNVGLVGEAVWKSFTKWSTRRDVNLV